MNAPRMLAAVTRAHIEGITHIGPPSGSARSAGADVGLRRPDRRSTLRDAFYRDYRCLLLSDCTAEPIGSQLSRGNHEASLLVIETLFGWVADSASLLAALRAVPARTTAGAPLATRQHGSASGPTARAYFGSLG
jgi:hypothetical protein